jgi:hypothetical protein
MNKNNKHRAEGVYYHGPGPFPIGCDPPIGQVPERIAQGAPSPNGRSGRLRLYLTGDQ